MRKTSLGLSIVLVIFVFLVTGLSQITFALPVIIEPNSPEAKAAADKNAQDLRDLDARNARAAKNGITGAEQKKIDDDNAKILQDRKNSGLYENGGKPTDSTATTGDNGANGTNTTDPAVGRTPDSEYDGYSPGGDNSNIKTNTDPATPTEDMSTDNILGVPTSDLRKGNVNQDTLPLVVISIIETLLAVAGTVAIFSLIYHAVQMQINSGITGDSSGVDKAKKGMIGSVIGFIIAILAWFLVTRAVELLGAATGS